MKNRFDDLWNARRILFVSVLLVTLATMLPSCRHAGPVHPSFDAHLDSVLNLVLDADSLGRVASQAHERNDLGSEMIALKYQGRELRHMSRYDEAFKVYDRCLDLATQLADTIEMVNALSGMGTVYRRLGKLSSASDYQYKALMLCDNYTDQDDNRVLKARSQVWNSIANIEMELYNFAFADSLLRLSFDAEQRLGNFQGMANNYRDLSMIKRLVGKTDSAQFYCSKSMEYSQLAESRRCVALCHLYFGDLHADERRFSHAIEEYKLAYSELKELKDSWHWLDAGLALSRVYILMGEEEEAHHYLDEAEVEAKRISSMDYQAEASRLHYELSLMQGNTQEALSYYIRSTELLDSIRGLIPGEDFLAKHIDYERGRSSGEVDVLNRDINKLKRSNRVRLLLTILSLLMAAAVIAALAYANRVRRRTQRLMSQVEETRSLFFTNVVHQLRSPLTAIMGTIDNMIVRGEAHPPGYVEEQRKDAQVIERQGKNLLTLVDRILEVGGVRSAIKDPEWRRGDAVSFIRMIIECYRDQCAERHIELTYAPHEASVDIVTVPRYLNTIVGNLLENAINYTDEYGKISVTSTLEGKMFTLRVADDGMGIDEKDLSHVLEPFYRGAAAEQLVEGIGIGLTVVRDMVMAMDGTVAVESVKNQGAVFTVSLPCDRKGVKERFEMAVEPLRDLPLRKEHLDQPEQDKENNDNLPVALVVEDQNDVARMVGQVLDKQCAVYYATDGEQGLAKACDLMPDLIITDVKMPLMDGLEMCRIIRKKNQLRHIPVIMLSARTSDADRIRGIEAGADVYLLKPFVREELIAWVNRLLESKRVSQEDKEDVIEPAEVSQPVATSVDEKVADEKFLADLALEVDRQFSMGNKLDLDRIALKYKMGETQLRRKIQALTGKNVPAHITQLRMEKAMSLLQGCPDCLIGDIAEQCGFQDVAYFSRVFRQYYGITPTQARNKQS